MIGIPTQEGGIQEAGNNMKKGEEKGNNVKVRGNTEAVK